MHIIRRQQINHETGNLVLDEETSVLSLEVAQDLVRRGLAVYIREIPDPPVSTERPGGEPPPLLLARLRAEGKLPPEPAPPAAQEVPSAPITEAPEAAPAPAAKKPQNKNQRAR